MMKKAMNIATPTISSTAPSSALPAPNRATLTPASTMLAISITRSSSSTGMPLAGSITFSVIGSAFMCSSSLDRYM